MLEIGVAMLAPTAGPTASGRFGLPGASAGALPLPFPLAFGVGSAAVRVALKRAQRVVAMKKGFMGLAF